MAVQQRERKGREFEGLFQLFIGRLRICISRLVLGRLQILRITSHDSFESNRFLTKNRLFCLKISESNSRFLGYGIDQALFSNRKRGLRLREGWRLAVSAVPFPLLSLNPGTLLFRRGTQKGHFCSPMTIAVGLHFLSDDIKL